MTSTNKLATLALAVVASGMAIAPSWAQNPNYENGDLVLFFQNPGGTTGADQLLFVRLGNTALNFRGAGAGIEPGQASFTLFNIDSALDAAFGTNWANEATLYAGLAGVWGTAGSISNTLVNGDPNRTVYTSRQRNEAGLGTLGLAGSAAWTVSTDGAMTNASSGIQGALATFETAGAGAVAQIGTGISALDENAPAGTTNFVAFANPGVQQQGTNGSFGSFGGVDNVEFALDLYRILAKTSAPGQVPGVLRSGSYEGSVVLGNDGNVSFIGTTVVPEPSSAMLVAGVLGAAGLVRRRRA